MLNKTHNIELIKKYPISVLSPKGLSAVSIVRPFNNAKSGLSIMEIWKDIKGYEGLYQVSNFARIKTLGNNRTRKQRIRKMQIGKRGYYSIILSFKHKEKRLYVHRLVAIAFIPNPENKPEINHLDGIKTNNNISNLEWTTPSENVLHSFKIGTQNNKGENHPRAKLTNKDVIKIKKEYKIFSAKELSKMYNISKPTIYQIINQKSWVHI